MGLVEGDQGTNHWKGFIHGVVGFMFLLPLPPSHPSVDKLPKGRGAG